MSRLRSREGGHKEVCVCGGQVREDEVGVATLPGEAFYL